MIKKFKAQDTFSKILILIILVITIALFVSLVSIGIGCFMNPYAGSENQLPTSTSPSLFAWFLIRSYLIVSALLWACLAVFKAIRKK